MTKLTTARVLGYGNGLQEEVGWDLRLLSVRSEEQSTDASSHRAGAVRCCSPRQCLPAHGSRW